MSDFSSFLALSPVQGGFWQITADMPFDLAYRDQRTRIVVPQYFVSDGPTIPALARLFFNPADSRYMKAAILHDYMLQTKQFSARQTAAAFRDALKAADVSRWRVTVMWLAVLVWTHWRQS